MGWLTEYSREKVNWFSPIDISKSVVCGIYMNHEKHVYEWTITLGQK